MTAMELIPSFSCWQSNWRLQSECEMQRGTQRCATRGGVVPPPPSEACQLWGWTSVCVIYAGSHPLLLHVLAPVRHYSNRRGNFCLFSTTATEVMVYLVRLFLFVSRIRERKGREKKKKKPLRKFGWKRSGTANGAIDYILVVIRFSQEFFEAFFTSVRSLVLISQTVQLDGGALRVSLENNTGWGSWRRRSFRKYKKLTIRVKKQLSVINVVGKKHIFILK